MHRLLIMRSLYAIFVVAVAAVFVSLPRALADVNLVVLLPADGGGLETESKRYFPLSPALESVAHLAVEHINRDGSLLAPGSDVALSVLRPRGGALEAVADVCAELKSNNNSAVAVISVLGSSSASVLGSFSNTYWHVPLLTVGAAAARSDGREVTTFEEERLGGGYLLGVHPDIYPQMKALVRLILDMKPNKRSGRNDLSERVSVLHTDDDYGNTASTAFAHAARTVSMGATVDIGATTAIPVTAGADYSSILAELVNDNATIVVLLAEGYDGRVVRSIFEKARHVGLVEGVQWYLPDAAAMDSVFQESPTYHNSALANEMRGTLGVRVCTDLTDKEAAAKLDNLTRLWEGLDRDLYPGARNVTADGQIDPLLAFAYDAVFVAAGAAGFIHDETTTDTVIGVSLDSCPFPTVGPWANGAVIRDAMYRFTLADTGGVTGSLRMTVGESQHYAAADGRNADTVDYCAVQLRTHSTMGARFVSSSALDGGELGEKYRGVLQDTHEHVLEQTVEASATASQCYNFSVVRPADLKPFLFYDEEHGVIGVTPFFLEKLKKNMTNVSFHFLDGQHSYSTMRDMVADGTADMAAGYISILDTRLEDVSFTYPYYDLHIAFVYKPTKVKWAKFWRAIEPFTVELWLLLGGCTVVATCLLWLFEREESGHFANSGEKGRSYRQARVTTGMLSSAYATVCLLMGQLVHPPKTLEGHILTVGWTFLGFALAASYTAQLALVLLKEDSTTDVSIDNMKGKTITPSQVALLNDTYAEKLYERDFLPLFQTNGSAKDDLETPEPCFSDDQCLEMVNDDNNPVKVTLLDSPTAEYLLGNKFCELEMLADKMYPHHYGLMLAHDSTCTRMFTEPTLRIRQDNIIWPKVLEYSSDGGSCDVNTSSDRMGIEHASGILAVCGSLMTLSLVMWCMTRPRRLPLAKSFSTNRIMESVGPVRTTSRSKVAT